MEARRIYMKENPTTSYAKVVKNCNCVCKCQAGQEGSSKQTNPQDKPSRPQNESGTTVSTLDVSTKDGSKISVLPKNLSKRKQNQLANKEKRSKNISSIC